MHSPESQQIAQGAQETSPKPSVGRSAVTVTKNSTMSKMRSHGGNVPTLPQTKFCHLCPAKFTRTTHLNRHLKTHSNERLHECERCHAHFTRSDLLTRHKRTCCDSSTPNRSRRKSCQSCADSKVKCDLQRPCARCKARNRECIYTNPLPPTRERESSVQEETSSDAPAAETSSSASPPSLPDIPSDIVSPPQPAIPAISNVASSSSLQLPAAGSSYSLETPCTMLATAATTPTYHPDPSMPLHIRQPLDEHSYLSELFSSEMYDNLFSDLFTSSFHKNPAIPGHHFHQDPTTALTDRLESAAIGQPSQLYDGPAVLAIFDRPTSSTAIPIDQFGNFLPADPPPQPAASLSMPGTPGQATPEQLHEYMTLFLTIFSYHMSIVHLPTVFQEERCPVLVKAMQACGAMYAANKEAAAKFIDSVLATARDEVIAELSSTSKTYEQIVQLTTASALIQTIGLFHCNSEQRAKSNVYHGIIVMMLRMNGFVDQTRDWRPQEIDFSDPVSVDRAWRRWVKHESAKRGIGVCYLHDCVHSLYFNLSPTFPTEQFTLGLPSEDGLWAAKNATEWAMLLQTPSPYGSIEVRLCGHYLKALYYYLTQNNPDNAPRPFMLSPFAHFIMIHAMLRKLFESYLRDRLPLSQTDSSGVRPKILPHFVDKDRAFHVQILLHYWLQSWLNSPETPRDVPPTQLRFFFNALPFYWLAQVSLVAYQEGLPPFDPEGTYIMSHDAKFSLMKKWERHCRKFLASGEQTATKFWDEVMKIRIETWQAETGFQYENLLGFFEITD
ncbi:hypothetical protein BD413DRAFT_605182 [Trametes elegans]|nr:hypothetical protein BD413DRAFT_605182 [Trametes elegans]